MRNFLLLSVALVLPFTAAAEDFKIGVVYVCNGEHVLVTGCDIHDMSEKGYCQAQWNDRPQHNGFPIYTSETRGSMRKLLPTCQPPTAKQIETRERADKVIADGQKKAVADQEEAFRRANQPTGPATDPGAIAARRCLAAGRSEMECISEGLGKSAKSLFAGTGLDTLLQQPAGLRLNGAYRAPGGFAISFNPGSSTVPATATVKCGKLEPQPTAYEISWKDGVFSIRIPNRPNPIPLTLRLATGRITGPAQATINGQVIVGWTKGGGSTQSGSTTVAHTETHMESHQIDYGEAHNGSYNATDINQNGMEYSVNSPVTSTTYETVPTPQRPVGPSPIYAPKTESCTIGALTSTGPTQPGPEGMAGLMDVIAGTDQKQPPVPDGIRIVGNYQAGPDLHVEFRHNLVLIDCAEVQLARPYTIAAAGADLLVHISDDTQPMAFTYHPDGTLTAPSSIHINGRVVTGTTGNGQITYAPKSGTCSATTLRPSTN